MGSPRLFARELTGKEGQQLTDAVRHSKSAAVVRRCQMILMSRQGLCPSEVARLCSASCSGVRKIINLFNRAGGLRRCRTSRTRADARARPTTATSLCSSKRCKATRARWGTSSDAGHSSACANTWHARKTRVIISTGYPAPFSSLDNAAGPCHPRSPCRPSSHVSDRVVAIVIITWIH